MDHAGIATQMVVERKPPSRKNEDRRSLGREEFVGARVGVEGRKRRHDLPAAAPPWRELRLSHERFTMDEGFRSLS